jgi:hypothetical protein
MYTTYQSLFRADESKRFREQHAQPQKSTHHSSGV